MAAFRWIQMSLFLMLVLQFTASTGTQLAFFIVRPGDEVTLPCGNRTDYQDDSVSTEWLFSASREVNTRSDRLSVTADCSLVLKTVTVEDVGFYTCRQNVSGKQQDAEIFLSVIDMAEQIINNEVTLNCYVLQYEDCRHEVEWLYEGKEEIFSHLESSTHSCSDTVIFPTSKLQQTSYESLTCKVTNTYNQKVQLFPFKHSSSVKKAGGNILIFFIRFILSYVVENMNVQNSCSFFGEF
ncbi:hypothetical protein CHARACLAT_014219 [Characodon lateralis]|uniref:Ig-like domain-containing protein n=1 Tax=Characodon lateralis TaxID=208331 RepID=A0ABU7DV33_9TELE|nr:hypothetical protein [Characodon lateralis]